LSALGFETGNLAEQEAKLHKAQDLLEEKAATMTAKQTKYNEVLAKYGEGSSQVASAQAALIKAENDLEQAQNTVNALTEEAANGTSAYGALMVDEEGKMRPFEDVLKDLQGAFAGLSEQEQISAATALFGTNQMTPWLALLNTAPERVDALSESLHNCDGTTQEMADTMMNGFGGGIKKLKSSIDVLIYNIGESLAPILQKAIDAIQGLVDKFNALSPAQKETIAKIALVAAAIGPFLIVVGKLTTGIGGMMIVFSKMPTIMTKIKGGFTAVKTAIMGISAPVVAIASVIAILVAAFKHLWETNEDFRNNIIAIWDGIKATFENLTSGIVDRLNALGFDFEDFTETLKYVWDWFCNYLAPIFENTFRYIGDILSDAVDWILGTVDFFFGLFTGNWEQCWNGIKVHSMY
ncbi:MAG: phage tail tape measure protein, partial [Ruminococcus sp.]|nr:phage tail tape measure protein [Ruminococcus sp.]